MEKSYSSFADNRANSFLELAAACFLCMAFIAGMTGAAFAEPPFDPQSNPNDNAVNVTSELREALGRHRTTASNRHDIEAVPRHLLYRTVFIHILLNESTYEPLFSEGDWDIITNLPDHSDSQFSTAHREELSEFCKGVSESAASARNARNLAVMADRIEQNTAARLSEHYNEVLESLSPRGRSLVEAEMAEYGTTFMMQYSRIDLVGLSADQPDYVANVIARTCSAFNADSSDPEAETVLLRSGSSKWEDMRPNE